MYRLLSCMRNEVSALSAGLYAERLIAVRWTYGVGIYSATSEDPLSLGEGSVLGGAHEQHSPCSKLSVFDFVDCDHRIQTRYV